MQVKSVNEGRQEETVIPISKDFGGRCNVIIISSSTGRERCKDRRIGQAYVKCWQTEEKEELCNDFKNYVTILKRFEKPVSAIGLNDWLDEHFNNVQNWCVRYWKPSRVEIVYRRLFDDNNIVSDPHVSDRLLWTYWNGEYYSKDD
jgi:maltooligosyltrehalose synthase